MIDLGYFSDSFQFVCVMKVGMVSMHNSEVKPARLDDDTDILSIINQELKLLTTHLVLS